MTTPEISKAQASEYEHVVLVDRSGSMGSPSKRIPGKTRWNEAQEHIQSLCNFLRDVDENGIDVVLFSSEVQTFDNVKTPEQVQEIFSNVQPRGTTNLAAAIKAAQSKRAASGGRQYFFHVLTDGEPDSRPAAQQAIAEAVRTMNKDSDLAISFLQIGDDPEATKFLKELDDDLQKNYKLPFDAVNSMTVAESEGLSYEAIMHLALND
jgi:hypothetical protein